MVLSVLVDNVARRRSHLFLELAKDVACVVISSLALNVVSATSQKEAKFSKQIMKKHIFWIFCFGIVKLAYREYSGGAVVSPVNPALSSRSSIVSWHSSYCCTNLHTESAGRIIVLKYEFSPSDLPVVLVNGKNCS